MTDQIIYLSHPKNWGLDEKMVINLAKGALSQFGYKKDVELSLVFVGRKKARDLNIKYRQKDYYPQVLGFPMSKEKDADGVIRLGDVVICTQKLKYEVRLTDKDLTEVLRDWMIHGVENLLKS